MTERLPPPPPLDGNASLYLDFDGTLVAIAERPEAVVVDGELIALINEARDRLGGRIALITGRAIDSLASLLPVRAVAISGSHGIELMWADGRRDTPPLPRELAAAVAEMHAFARARPGLLVEEKPFGAALHYRGRPQAAAEAAALVAGLAERTGMGVQSGKMVVELRAAGTDKGDALRRLHRAAPYSGHRPLFVGDDDTDEPAFRAAAALGGAGILVGPVRETSAAYRLEDVAAVHRWLRWQA